MADPDTRMLHFTTPVGMEASTSACRGLTAPGMNEIYGHGGPKETSSLKRPAPDQGLETVATAKSASAKKRARNLANKKKAWEQGPSAGARGGKGTGGQAALPPPPPLAAIEDRRPRGTKKGEGKSTGKAAGKGALPKGIRPKTEDNKLVCYAHNKGEVCVQDLCHFEHVCWWCHGRHAGGAARTAACGPA